MTIRDNGGVFGRNPSLNNVTASDLIATNVEIPQGGKLYIGNGAVGGSPRGDLEIYHDGSNSRIDEVFAGNLIIRAHDRIQFGGYVSGKNFIIMQDGGAVSLWHDGSNKLQTASTGVSVTGNVIVASGNGIDFSATDGTGTSELFDDYEEGTWTPTVTAATGTFTTVSASGFYTKIGRIVSFSMSIVITDAGTAAGNITATLPFAATSINAIATGREIAATGSGCQGTILSGSSNCIIQRYDTVSIIGTGRTVVVTGTYIS